MNLQEVREKIGEINGILNGLETKVKAEDRSFTDDENKTWDDNIAKLEKLTEQRDKLAKQEEIRANAAKDVKPVTFEVNKGEDKEIENIAKRFSFVDVALAAMGSKKLEGAEREMDLEGRKELSSIGHNARGFTIPTSMITRAAITENSTSGIEGRSFIDAVYSNTIIDRLGVTRYDAVLDQRIPIFPALSTQWEGETDAAADGGSALSKLDLSPRRLASYADVSTLATMQHPGVLEGMIRSNFARAVAAKVQYALFTNDSSNGAYNYLGNGKTPVNGASLSALVNALMQEIMDNNHDKGSLGFAMSNDLFTLARTEAQVSGVNALYDWATKTVAGLPAEFSNQIADISSKPVAYYGDWSYVHIAQFGAIDVLYDPYTQAVSGKNRLVLSSFWDAALTKDAAISVGTYTAP